MKIIKRLPNRNQVFPVYGLIVMGIYGWSIIQFLRDFTGWIKFLTLGEISSILAYTLTIDIFESLFLLAGLVAFAVVLPLKWFQEDFIVQGGANAIYIIGMFMFVAFLPNPSHLPENFIVRRIIDLTLLQFVIRYLSWPRNIIKSLADRSTVFLYLTIPASLIAVIVVIIRNIIDLL